MKGTVEEVGGIAPRRIWRASCSTCGISRDVVGSSLNVPSMLRKIGWSRVFKKWYCPQHKDT